MLIRNKYDCLKIIGGDFDESREIFLSLSLNDNNLLLEKNIISIGDSHSFMLDLELVERVLRHNQKVLFAHSHLGNLIPSKEDFEVAKVLNTILVNHNIVDHLIFNKSDIVSYKRDLENDMRRLR